MSEQLSLPFPEWRDIPGYEGLYQVSNTGLIYSLRLNKVLSLKPQKSGYVPVQLRKDGRGKHTRIHCLVMLAFVGPSELHVNHKNGIKTDNRLENLEYVTRSENLRHAVRVLGRKLGFKTKTLRDRIRGEQHGQAKLTEEKVREIRRLAESGISSPKIAAMFGTTRSNVRFIVKRKAWKHVE